MKRFLLTTIAVTIMAFSVKAQNGTCGDNLTWNYNSSKSTLTISGTGPMWDYTKKNPSPWNDISYKAIVIEDYVTSIGNSAFKDSPDLESITFGNSILSIGDYAFQACKNIESITINSPACTMGMFVFADCINLKSVTLPQTLTDISNYAFYGCFNLETITIPDGVISIGEFAFYECSSLASIMFPHTVTTLGSMSFANCSSLKEIFIPNTLITIEDPMYSGYNVFRRCYNIESIVVEPGNPTFDSRENCDAIIETETNRLVTACKNTIIPSSVTTIGAFAFSDNESTSFTIPNFITDIDHEAFVECCLTSITIGESVNYIGYSAFNDHMDTIVCFLDNPPLCDVGAFDGVDYYSCMLFVPEASWHAYYTADEWGKFVNIIGIDIAGVDENQMANVSIYPNPAHNFLNINCEDMTSLEIFSIDGKLIKMMPVAGDEAQIDISDLESGMYIYSILSENNKFAKGKFVKN